MPAEHLGAKLILTEDDHLNDYMAPNEDGAFRWRLTEEGAEYPDVEGTVVWTRPDMNRAIHGAAMAQNGHRVLAEVDDNYLSPKEQNIFMRIGNYDASARSAHMKAFRSMDGIICSTEWLRDRYFKVFKEELGSAPEMFVARNHIDPEAWEDRDPLIETARDGRLRVGWAGSHQHVWDLRLAAPALDLAYRMGAEIVLIGLDPAMHDPKWKEFLPEYTHVPWKEPHLYHRHYINIDIGICPLVTNQHTLGKSDIKAMEYTMSGAAVVAQNNTVYNRSWKHNETCLLAGSPDEMAFAVAELMNHPQLRHRLQRAAREYVLSQRTIQGNIQEWEGAIVG